MNWINFIHSQRNTGDFFGEWVSKIACISLAEASRCSRKSIWNCLPSINHWSFDSENKLTTLQEPKQLKIKRCKWLLWKCVRLPRSWDQWAKIPPKTSSSRYTNITWHVHHKWQYSTKYVSIDSDPSQMICRKLHTNSLKAQKTTRGRLRANKTV